MSSVVIKRIESVVMDLTREALNVCASKYNFNAEEAWELVNESVLSCVSRESGKRSNTPVKKSIPLPYNGECIEENCQALRQNNGLYTQCELLRNNESEYCSSCEKQLVDGIPMYGTIKERKAVGILDYIAPNGKKPVAYHTIMKKMNITKEEVLEEAGKQNKSIDPIHFEVVDRKRGRRKVEKETKEVKEPKSKGRPKKQKKVIELSGDNSDDLFATLVANLSISSETDVENSQDSDNEVKKETNKTEKKETKKAEKEAEKAKKEAEKAKKEAEKAKKEAEKEAEKAKKENEKAEKEAKKAEKEAKKAEKEAKKAEKEVKKEVKKEEKMEVVNEEPEEEPVEEPEVVKKITQDGKTYLKSKKSGIIYDYENYLKNGEHVVVGKWNETTQKIDFDNDEESEDEYESDHE